MRLIILMLLMNSCAYHYEYSYPSEETEKKQNTEGNSSKGK